MAAPVTWKDVSASSRLGLLALLLAAAAGDFACKKSSGADTGDASADASGERPILICPEVDAGAAGDAGAIGDAAAIVADGGTGATSDEFGPNAPLAKTASALGRVNVYEVTSPRLLQRIDVYLRADLDQTRLTIAVQEAASRTTPFSKVTDVQIDVGTCQGWATSGPLAIPLAAGHFYAIGFDPNQVVLDFVSADADSLPIDGAFGRLIGSKTATSVSVPTLTWDKLTDKEFNRQRLVTSPRVDDGDGGTKDSGATGEAGSADAAADAAGDAPRG